MICSSVQASEIHFRQSTTELISLGKTGTAFRPTTVRHQKSMNAQSSSRAITKSTGFQIFMLGLSIYAIAALLIDLVVALPPHVSRMIQHFDVVVCIVFLCDFLIQFYHAPSKLGYLRVGWIDLLASIPAIDLFRWGRLVRILRILRVVRAVRGGHKVLQFLFANRGSASGSAGVTFVLLLAFSSISILMVENGPQSNIKTPEDAIWWSFTTISTVGYGDHYPTTTEGRIIAIILMLAGVGLLGSFTALIASYFIGSQEAEDDQKKGEQLRLIETKLDSLQQSVLELQRLLAKDQTNNG